MKVYSSCSRWAALFALLFCLSTIGRLAAAESDDEPTPAAGAADDAGSDDAKSDDANSDDASAGDTSSDDANAESGTTADTADDPPAAATGADPAGADDRSMASQSPDAEPAAADSGTDEQTAAEPSESTAKKKPDPDAPASQQPTAADEDPTAADLSPSLRPAESKLTIEAASFKGIQPGKSTTAELAESWGVPKEIRKQKGRRVQIYEIDVFPRVTVTLAAGVVNSVVVNLDKPMGCEELARQLSIDDISSVQVSDDQGLLLGEAFPERGVMFGYAPKSDPPRVSQVVLEPIDAAPFLLRAETHLHTHYARCLADANAALTIDPKSAQAQGLRARVYLRAGDISQALKAAQAAADLEPQETEWTLLAAKILIETADFKRAQQQIHSVLESKETSTLTKAKAHCLLGDCLALTLVNDEEAMKQHLQAIKLAEPLVNSSRLTVRRGAKEVLLDAHLGAATDVGWGHWQQKNPSITKWVERASAFAQDLVQHEQADEDLLQRVDRQALVAMAGVAEPSDAAKWIKDYVNRAGQLIAQTTDTARQAQLEWELGLVLSDAAGIEQMRGHHEKGLEYGRLALKHLEQGKPAGRQLPCYDFLLGQLLYKIGATAAIGEHNHRRAVEWYGRAVSLLETPVPPSRLTDPGRHGETFVSIAVSYWELGQRDEALRLTKQGLKLMEQAIEDGLLAKSALAVPYGNLASMHAELGNKRLAAEFAELSAKCQRAKR